MKKSGGSFQKGNKLAEESKRLTVKRFIAQFDTHEKLKGYDLRAALRTALNMTKEELLETLNPQNANDIEDERQTEKIPILLQLILGFITKANNSTRDFLEVVKFAYTDLSKDDDDSNKPQQIIINWTPPPPEQQQ